MSRPVSERVQQMIAELPQRLPVTREITMTQILHNVLNPVCACDHGLQVHDERFGCDAMDIDNEPCLCWVFVSADPDDVTDDDGFGGDA